MGDTSNGLKSNEEIIEELTKDLGSSCIRVDENSVSNDNTTSSTKRSDLSDNFCERLKASGDDDIKCETENAQDTNLPKDFVDEELLKDREVTLSESEKEVHNCLLINIS